MVKTFCRCFFEKGNTRKSECFQGFSAFLKTHVRKLPARSQTSRATSCATPRKQSFSLLSGKNCPIIVTRALAFVKRKGAKIQRRLRGVCVCLRGKKNRSNFFFFCGEVGFPHFKTCPEATKQNGRPLTVAFHMGRLESLRLFKRPSIYSRPAARIAGFL